MVDADPLPKAFVTLLTTPSYLPGALVLLHALHDLHPAPRDFKIVCLVTPETVDAKSIGELRRAGYDLVIGVEPIGSGLPGKSALQLMGRPDLNLALTKLHLFRLHNLFSTLIYLDADVLPIRPLASLFESTAPHVLSACPDTGWPDCFNSGVMVIRPRESDWEGMRRMLRNGEGDDGIYETNGSFDGADQGLLNEWFSPEGEGGDWNRLPFTYNVTPTAAYTYAPAYKRYGHKINAVHFIGPNKPWANLAGRPAGMGLANGKEGVFDYPSLVDRWYAVYDRHVRPTSAHEPDVSRRFSVPEHQAVWNQPGGIPHQPEDRLDLDQLKTAAMWGIQAAGQYTSMPLDGRVDLIMPKPKRVTFAPDTSSSGSSSETAVPSHPADTEPTAMSPTNIAAPLPQTFQQQTQQPSTWDAQRYSPPKSSGPEMKGGMDAYYAPAWEQPPATQSSWYQAPPPRAEPFYPSIPDNVRNDQWYGQWTHSEPDYQAVQQVFPWEAHGSGHHQPSRVFPKESAPPRPTHKSQLSINVTRATPPSASPARRRSPSPPPPPPAPPKSMAEAMASYTNAWDADPAIQNYISLITGKPIQRPGHTRGTSIDVKSIPGTPTATTFHLRERSDRSDASEYGDDEDETDDSTEDPGNSPKIGFAGSTDALDPFPMARYPANPKYRDRHAQTDKATMQDAKVQAQPGGGASPVVRMVELPRPGGGPMGTTPKARRTSAGSSGMGKRGPAPPAPFTPASGGPAGAGGASAKQAGSSSSETTPKQNIVTPPSDSVARLSRPGLLDMMPTKGSASNIPTRNTFKNNFDLTGAHVGPGAVGGGAGVGAGGGGKPQRTFDPSTDVDARRKETQDVLSRFMASAGGAAGAGAGSSNGNGNVGVRQ